MPEAPGIRSAHGLVDRLRFLAAFLRNPGETGSLFPSSVALARSMLEGLDLRRARTVVELGPGTGSFTALIRERIGPETCFLAMELDRGHVETLRRKFPSVRVCHASAEHLPEHLHRNGCEAADFVISGLPWANMGPALQDRILEPVARCTAPEGVFVTFSYIHGLAFPTAVRFRRRLRQLYRQVSRGPVVWRNLPPAVTYAARGRA